jgi:hypothetical protein
MSSSYEFWVPSNQNTSSSALTTTGPGGVEYIGDPEHLSNSNELIFGNAIKTQMGNTVNSYLGGYTANYTPYYIATILGGYQQTIMGAKSEAVFGVKMEYKLAGKYEWVFGDAGENKNVLSLSTRSWGVTAAVKTSSTTTTEATQEQIVGGDFGVTVAGVMNEEFTEQVTEGVSQELVLADQSVEIEAAEHAYVSYTIVADEMDVTCPMITLNGIVLLG